MLWTIAIAVGIAQIFALLLGAAALRAAGRADRRLEGSQEGGRSA